MYGVTPRVQQLKVLWLAWWWNINKSDGIDETTTWLYRYKRWTWDSQASGEAIPKKNAEDLFHIVWRHLFYMSHPHILSINRQWIWSGLSILLDHPMNYKCLIFMLFTWWIDISDKCAVSLLKCVSDDGYIRYRQIKHVEIWKHIFFNNMGFMVQVAWMSSH